MNFSDDGFFPLMERKRRAFAEASVLYGCRFDRDNGQVPQLAKARTYAGQWHSIRKDRPGLLFWGQPGNGKTFAAACIANALIEEPGNFLPEVRMATFGAILRSLLAQSPQEKEEYIRDLITCDLLILDDFGMERQTEYAREQIFNIVDGRYLSGLPLIVTTNLSLQELKNPTSIAERRVYDRILEMCVPVCFDGASLRPGKARENLSRYRKLTDCVSAPALV